MKNFNKVLIIIVHYHVIYNSYVKYIELLVIITQLLDELSLKTLGARRHIFDIMMIYEIINGFIDFPDILSKVRLHSNNFNLRQRELFYIEEDLDYFNLSIFKI